MQEAKTDACSTGPRIEKIDLLTCLIFLNVFVVGRCFALFRKNTHLKAGSKSSDTDQPDILSGLHK